MSHALPSPAAARHPRRQQTYRPGGGLLLAVALLISAVLSGCGGGGESGGTPAGGSAATDGKLVIAMLPKLKNIAYFDACHRGARAAADELGVELIYDGPDSNSGSEQSRYMETWIRQGVSAICVAPNQPRAIRRLVERASQAGIPVFTWDTDALESGRQLMVAQVDDKVLGETLVDDLAAQMGGEGKWAIAIASLDAANLNSWRLHAENRAKTKYPGMTLVDTVVTNEDENRARELVGTLLGRHPDLGGIIAFDSNSVPGAADAIERAEKVGEVALTGNSLPNTMRPFIKRGVLQSFYLWDPRALGELSIRVAVASLRGEKIEPGTELEGYGPLTFSEENPTTIILSKPVRFTKDNIDDYDF
ncbi:MAG: autoinducer 2 ABC transporter substrate-binding protein [Planctomycetaceae bacterium]|nr:autoinducer 2 ABC transporter substrate-binding protein [Planctomycetaceae bacterium]